LKQLKVGARINYGISYQGSKTKLIEHIAKFFPNADHFYDLFGGGFSVTHYMLKHRANSYKQFHFNEIRPGICNLIQDAINGKYNYNVFKPEWISKERFEKEKESSPYIKMIWSFGNNGKDYLFGKDIEQQKRAMHQAVVFDEFNDFMKKTFAIDKWPNHLDIPGKRLYLRMVCRKLEKEQRFLQLQQLEQLERLQRLEQLERLQQLQQLEQPQQFQRLDFTNLDYRKIKIEKSSIIYCDIPYFGTADYGEFSHKDFFNWADSQTSPVFVSEYSIKDDRFTLLKEFSHRSTFSAAGAKNIPVMERLYGNHAATAIIQNYRQQKYTGRTAELSNG
jgi:site-specific DNA-adenine methylase